MQMLSFIMNKNFIFDKKKKKHDIQNKFADTTTSEYYDDSKLEFFSIMLHKSLDSKEIELIIIELIISGPHYQIRNEPTDGVLENVLKNEI